MGRHIPSTTKAATTQTRLEAMRVEGNRILNAKSLIIIGGGLIGTELAGDVAAHAKAAGKSNDITLIHSGDRLCPMMSEPASKAVLKMLENLNVKVILNEKAVENADGAVELLNSKKTLNANAVIQTIGFTPNNAFVDSTRFPKALDDLGWIQTDDFFVVPGTDGKIFAYGDCSPTMPNAGFQYMEASSVLGRNLYASLTSKPNNMKPKPDLMVGLINTIGTSQGIMYTSFFWTRRVFPWLKNKTMFFMALNGMIGVKKDFTMAAA
ncbi:NADH:flavorubredoxin oxidoreductase [Nitzschia inconspicua]|uniref:NADH:flavorubredoxin oxidoreductase n=1 Tax=Nitzschia inconspicua TaxID=303405 RepID=A0A9K3M563_9STRA|nr:NADH:flavorubredoxin oxidoreductase [Nitzschia inconspicua]